MTIEMDALDAEVATSCPRWSAEIVASLPAGGPRRNDALVLWLPTASCSHVVTQFSPGVNFFCNHDHLHAWRSTTGDAKERS